MPMWLVEALRMHHGNRFVVDVITPSEYIARIRHVSGKHI